MEGGHGGKSASLCFELKNNLAAHWRGGGFEWERWTAEPRLHQQVEQLNLDSQVCA